MANSIFIGSSFVIGIEYEDKGTSTIKKYIEIPIQEGSIINGNILNMMELTGKLTSLRQEHGFEAATLILDTSEVQSISTLVPHLKKLEYQRIAESELNRESATDRIVHYKISKNTRSGEGNTLFAVAIPDTMVESYKELFSIAGIKLKAIRLLEELVDSMFDEKKLVKEESVIINILSSDIMYTAIYGKGKRIFSQRTRLGLDTNGLSFELGNSLVNLEQFNKAQRNPEPEKVYYVGLEDEVLEELRKTSFVDINIEKLDMGEYLDQEIKDIKLNPVFMGIFEKDTIDLLKHIKTADELAARNITPIQKLTLGIVSLAMVATLVMGALILVNNMQLKSIMDYVNDPINMAEYQEVNEIKTELSELETVIAQVQAVEQYIGQYNIVEIPLMEDIQLVAGDSARLLSLSFDQVNNIVSATLETKDASSASSYVRELKRMGFNIADINYTGYTESNPHIYLFTANIIPQNNKEIFEQAIDYSYAEEAPIVDIAAPEQGDDTLTETPDETSTQTGVTVDDAVTQIQDTESTGGVVNE